MQGTCASIFLHNPCIFFHTVFSVPRDQSGQVYTCLAHRAAPNHHRHIPPVFLEGISRLAALPFAEPSPTSRPAQNDPSQLSSNRCRASSHSLVSHWPQSCSSSESRLSFHRFNSSHQNLHIAPHCSITPSPPPSITFPLDYRPSPSPCINNIYPSRSLCPVDSTISTITKPSAHLLRPRPCKPACPSSPISSARLHPPVPIAP